jgi:hypothetical protein
MSGEGVDLVFNTLSRRISEVYSIVNKSGDPNTLKIGDKVTPQESGCCG